MCKCRALIMELFAAFDDVFTAQYIRYKLWRVKKMRCDDEITLMFHLINFYRYHNINCASYQLLPLPSLCDCDKKAWNACQCVPLASRATPCDSTWIQPTKLFVWRKFPPRVISWPSPAFVRGWKGRVLRTFFQSNLGMMTNWARCLTIR